jgi:predicted PurR-regulated permease PerM
MNKEALKEIRNIVLIVAIVVVLIVYSGNVITAIEGVAGVFTPFLAGVAIAFVLNLPMSFIETKIFAKWPKGRLQVLKRTLGIILAILFICLLVALLFVAVIPGVRNTITDVSTRFPEFYNQLNAYIEDISTKYPVVDSFIKEDKLSKLDFEKVSSGVLSVFSNGVAGNIVSSTVGMASSVASFFVKALTAIVFAIYLLAAKERIIRGFATVLKTYLPRNYYEGIRKFNIVLVYNFKRFIEGQCLEAIILGLIFAIVLSIFKMPYVMLISMMIAFTALIPVVGALIGCLFGCALIIMVSPIKMLEYIVISIIVQQLENKFVYPRVVGSSVGLPSIWVFMAVMVGGSLCGVIGMIVFIPLTSTFYQLLKEDVRKRREISEKTADNSRNSRNNRKHNKNRNISNSGKKVQNINHNDSKGKAKNDNQINSSKTTKNDNQVNSSKKSNNNQKNSSNKTNGNKKNRNNNSSKKD